jgi:hypothetical protein
MRAGTRRSKKQRDFGPILRGMMRKCETVHGAGHMDISKQHMDARSVDLKNAQSGFGVFGFDNFEACILQGSDDNQTDQFLVFGHKDKNLVRHLFSPPNNGLNSGHTLRFPLFQAL